MGNGMKSFIDRNRYRLALASAWLIALTPKLAKAATLLI